jgi:hypothetical protein
VARLTYEVRLEDLTVVMQHDAMHWARSNCLSFRAMFAYESEFIDSEVEYYDFVFEQEHDATLFGLKFGSY